MTESPPGPWDPRSQLDELRRMAFALAEEMVRDNPDTSLDDLNAALDRRVAQYNSLPQPELGGLAPDQLHLLLSDDCDGSGVIGLRTDLPLAELEHSRLLGNARMMLGYLASGGPVRSTASGNLTRAVVAALANRMQWEPGYLAEVYRYSKVMNEEDVQPLHILRVLLELAGLVKRRKGSFSITRRGQGMLDEAKAGKLFALLFRTHFRELNLAYLTRMGPDLPELQNTLAYTLYKLQRTGNDWKTSAQLAPHVILPSVHARIPANFDWASVALENRVLRPLEALGLVRRQPTAGRELLGEKRRYRTAPLFGRFLSFSFDDAQGGPRDRKRSTAKG